MKIDNSLELERFSMIIEDLRKNLFNQLNKESIMEFKIIELNQKN